MVSDTIRLLIIEEHMAVREALATRLASTPGIDVVGTAGNMRLGLVRVRRQKPNVVLLGLQHSNKADLQAIGQNAAALARLGAAVIVLTSYAEDIERELVLEMGARRYLVKDINTPQLIDEIEAVVREAAVP